MFDSFGRHHFRHPYYILIFLFTCVALRGLSGFVAEILDPRSTAIGRQPGVNELSRTASVIALGAACAGVLILVRAWLVYDFPARTPICILLLLMDFVLVLIVTHPKEEFVYVAPGPPNDGACWLMAALAFVSLLLHHLLDVGVY